MRVNFIIAGAQKAGTSALDAYLREHPGLQMAKVKEVHFFDNEGMFQAPVDYNAYHRCFDTAPDGQLLGEATPIYMYWEPAARRIWEYNPEMKVIVVLRNPVDRAFSHWNMERERGADSLNFSDAIRQEADRCREALPHQHRVFSYVDRGFYTEQLRRLFRFFGREQVLAIKYEELRHEPSKALGQISRFLQVAEFPAVQDKTVHKRDYEQPMPESDRDYLNSIYHYEIRQLEQLLTWDCSDWLQEE